VKIGLNQQAADLAAQNAAFGQIARTAARFFATGRGAITIRLPDRIAYIGRHGIPHCTLPKEYDLGAQADNPRMFKDMRKSRIKVFRQLSQLQGGIAFFACAPIFDYRMNRIGLLSVGDYSPMDHPAGKLATLQDLAKIAFEHLVLLLQTLDCPMHADEADLQSPVLPALLPAAAIDPVRPIGQTSAPPSFGDHNRPNFNGEPVSNFLTRTLMSKRQIRNRKNVTYLTVKTWKKSIKDAQLSAIRALKEFGPEELAIRGADDIKSALEGLLGALDFDFVTSIPCTHTKRDTCLSVLIGQKISSATGIPFKHCFEREFRAGSSHPAKNSRLPALRLKEPAQGKILLVDDVATSGTHIEKAAKRLRENGSSVFCVAWIGNA